MLGDGFSLPAHRFNLLQSIDDANYHVTDRGTYGPTFHSIGAQRIGVDQVGATFHMTREILQSTGWRDEDDVREPTAQSEAIINAAVNIIFDGVVDAIHRARSNAHLSAACVKYSPLLVLGRLFV